MRCLKAFRNNSANQAVKLLKIFFLKWQRRGILPSGGILPMCGFFGGGSFLAGSYPEKVKSSAPTGGRGKINESNFLRNIVGKLSTEEPKSNYKYGSPKILPSGKYSHGGFITN